MIREEELKKQASIYTDDADNYLEYSDDRGWTDKNDKEFVEKAFIEGAKWADTHPINHWISVEDGLPCNNNNLLVKCLPYNSKLTKPVLALVADGSYKVCDMFVNEEGKWEWSYNDVVLYWFPIPELPEE